MALTRLPGFIIDSTSSFTFAEANVTGNLVVPNISTNTYVNFTGASNVSLGAVGNLHITGGTANYVLSTDGAGNLSWVAQTGGGSSSNISNGTSNVSIPVADGNINLSASGNANVVVVTGNGINVTGTITIAGSGGNLSGANYVTANYFSGSGNNLSNIQAANISGTVANANYSLYAGTLLTNAQPNITSVGTLTDLSVSGNAIIAGNLTVSGTTTYVNVTNLAVSDPLIQLQSGPNGAAPSSNTGKDVGTALNYYDTSAKVAFMGWDVSNAEFGFGNTVSIASEVVTFTSYGNVRAGYFIGNGSQLTGITSAAYANYISNGTSNVNIPTASGNVTVGVSGNANIVTVTGTGVNVAGTLNATGNANVGNIGATNGVFTNVSGNGSALSSITGGNVTGQVANALIAGTVYTAAQPNITSVGTLSSLSVTGNISSGNANLGNLTTSNYFSGNGSLLTSITGGNVTGQIANALVAGTVYTAAQPNITSVGTLSNLTSNGTINFTGASNVSLGAVGNVKITGGTANYVLSTDGSGNLNWVAQSGGSGSSSSTTDAFTGNGVATSFTLSVTPSSKDWTVVNYNGAIVLRSDYTLTGNVIAFTNAPANGAKIEVTTVTLSGGGGGGSSTAATVGYALVFGG